MSAGTAAGFAIGTPDPSVRDVVLRYEGFAVSGGGPAVFREVACTFVPIIIDLDKGWAVSHREHVGSAPLRLNSFVAGLTDGPVLVGHAGSARCLQVDLTPLGARRVLGLPLAELANRSVSIEAVLGRDGAQLVERIGDAATWQERFAIVDDALVRRLRDAVDVDAEVAWSLERIVASGGNLAVGTLATELGWSHRKLIARYRDAVGLPPKAVARIVRFERVCARLRGGAGLAVAAAECGYFDQAHLSREVRELAGITPGELQGSVNSVQDPAV
ncbi:helix-turn-helix domain-containing protein [Mycolicibacterium iranicum]|uniref:helix-turn-helix domain-containing protein n=1 Tax=Mycolicibacterium iranicum TaxID=912594 RepID=UPI0010423E83|nr:helix-turn-helix domain-containing protein [Mycolicibacterium iranicum]